MSRLDELQRIAFADRAGWRAWLADHHDSTPGVWLVYHKKASGNRSVTYDEAVEEALCFGWIDSKVNALDDDRYMQVFTPRKKGSVWSRLNKERVARLVANGLMTPAGRIKIEAAKEDGSWALLDAVDDLVVPDDLRAALDADPVASANFAAFSDSVKKPILWHVYSAKRTATREQRIAEIVKAAAENLSVAEYRERRSS
jgi:uncharacterized protein YdeI (YjbR/CyaY-like superfamily)